ncbi:MAG: hypothetical protein ACREPQ_14735 [Rhodanobacter sp.]
MNVEDASTVTEPSAEGAVHASPSTDAQTPGTDVARRPARDAHNWSADNTQAGRKSDNFTFVPRDSTLYFTRKHTLCTPPIQRAYGQIYERTAYALHEVDIILPIVARANDEAIEKVSTLVDNQFHKLERFLEVQNAQLQAVIDADGGEMEQGAFSGGVQIEVRVYSPRARRLLDMIVQFDNLVAKGNHLHLASLMDQLEFRRFCFNCRVELVRVGRTIWKMHDVHVKALRRVSANAKRQAEEAPDHLTREAALTISQHADELLATSVANSVKPGDDILGERALALETGMNVEDALADGESEHATGPRRASRRAAAH